MIMTAKSMTCFLTKKFVAVFFLALLLVQGVSADHRSISIQLDAQVTSEPKSGRVFVLVTDQSEIAPKDVTWLTAAYYFNNHKARPYAPFFAEDVSDLAPGNTVTLSGNEQGFPFAKLADLPPGTYFVQAVFHLYEKVTPAHGKTIWLPMDDWEGSQFHQSPGNFYSDVVKLNVKEDDEFFVNLELTNVIPTVEQPADTELVKFRKFRSKLASDFWSRDIPVGINVVLPKGYHDNPEARYPVVFHMGHFVEFVPLHLPASEPSATNEKTTEGSPRWHWENWMASETPRFIAVSLLHPTPFYDDSYLVNSENTGPWQDVFIEEILPYLNREFRTIDEPWARVMTGGSTGGWISLYTQVTKPELFGGAWIYCPDMVDYRALVNTNMYVESNYYKPDGFHWLQPERPYSRTVDGKTALTARQFGQLASALGTKSRGGEWIDAYAAMFGPVGDDGYPVPLIDWTTGEIDNNVAEIWRDNGFDLRYFLEKNWKELGPKLSGQLYFLCGDMDQFYCNNAMYFMEDFLESTTEPYYNGSFRWGRPMIGHTFYNLGTDPWPFGMLNEMAGHIRANSPDSFDHSQWNYE